MLLLELWIINVILASTPQALRLGQATKFVLCMTLLEVQNGTNLSMHTFFIFFPARDPCFILQSKCTWMLLGNTEKIWTDSVTRNRAHQWFACGTFKWRIRNQSQIRKTYINNIKLPYVLYFFCDLSINLLVNKIHGQPWPDICQIPASKGTDPK